MDTNLLQQEAQERTDPAVVEAIYAAGHLLHSREQWADAAAMFRLMLTAAPTDERAWLALGECHERAGHQLVALELYSAGTVAAEPSPRCLIARARLLHELGRRTEALEAWDAAEELSEAAEEVALAELVRSERGMVS